MYMDGSFELIKKFDPEIANLTVEEEQRQLHTLCLIASENYASPLSVGMEGTVWANKNAEGYPGRRFAGGCELADQIEHIAIDRCKQVFGCEYVNIQSMSSTLANIAVLRALLQPGDTMFRAQIWPQAMFMTFTEPSAAYVATSRTGMGKRYGFTPRSIFIRNLRQFSFSGLLFAGHRAGGRLR